MRGPLLLVAAAGLGVSLLWLPVAPPLWIVGFWCLVVLVGLVVERYRYKPIETAAVGPGWVRTPESFVDPETGVRVAVLYDAASGERRYVRADGTPGSGIDAAAPGR